MRFGEDLCLSERAFLSERKRFMRSAFARLMGVSENTVDERDIPIIAIAGSGGGECCLGTVSGICDEHLTACLRRIPSNAEYHRLVDRGRPYRSPSLYYLYSRCLR